MKPHSACYANAKLLQSCLTLCDPIDGSPPGSPSLGFSRQEHCSGLPLLSPMHENEKWKWSHSVVSNPQWPHGLQPSRLLLPWDFPGKSTGVGCHHLLRWVLRDDLFKWDQLGALDKTLCPKSIAYSFWDNSTCSCGIIRAEEKRSCY